MMGFLKEMRRGACSDDGLQGTAHYPGPRRDPVRPVPSSVRGGRGCNQCKEIPIGGLAVLSGSVSFLGMDPSSIKMLRPVKEITEECFHVKRVICM